MCAFAGRWGLIIPDPFWSMTGKVIFMKKNKECELYAKPFDEEEWRAMGLRISNACTEAGYNLSDLGRLLTVGRRQIYRIVSGELPCKSEYIYEFSQALGVSTDYLFFGDEEPECAKISALCKGRTKKELVNF